MLTKLKKNNQGFTIVEVMIVLAIAALILLIVLLAVPAVQRNSRNTAIKNDASTVAGGISTFESDNSGLIPTGLTSAGGTVTITDGTAANNETVQMQGSSSIAAVATHGTVPATGGVTVGTLQYDIGESCVNDVDTISARSIAIFYPIETTNGVHTGCITG